MSYVILAPARSRGLGDWTSDAQSAAQQYFGKAQAAVTDETEKLKVAAYEYAYKEGRQLLDTVQNLPTVQRMVTVGNVTYDLGQTIYQAIGDFRSGKIKFDPSGVLTTTSMASSIVQLGTNLALAFGADPGVAAEVNQWVGVGATCATSLVAGASAGGVGAVGGAAVCALSVIAKLLGSLGGKQVGWLEDWRPRAYYTPTQEQVPHAERDALRLATVLHYWYGQKNLDEIVGRLRWWRYFRTDELYPTKPPVDPKTGGLSFSERSEEALPGVDPYGLLQAFSFGCGAQAAGDNIRRCLFVVAGQRLKHELESGTGLLPGQGYFDLMQHYVAWHDINVSAIRTGAALGRAAAMRFGVPTLPVWAQPWSEAAGIWAKFFTDDTRAGTFDFSPFIQLGELVNFFVAVTLGELVDGSRSAPAEDAYLGSRLPVRFYGALGSDGKNYDLRHWTDLYHAGGVIDSSRPGGDILSQVKRGNIEALYEYALIRLSAALSHMVLNYSWTGRVNDAVAVVASRAPAAGTYAWKFRATIDPRQAINGVLKPAEKVDSGLRLGTQYGLRLDPIVVPGKANNIGSADPIRDPVAIRREALWVEQQLKAPVVAARRAAYDDHDKSVQAVSGKTGALLQQAQTKTVVAQQNTAALTRLHLAPGSLQTWDAFKSSCEAAGGVATDSNGSWLCSPTAKTRARMEAECRAKGYEPSWIQNGRNVQLVYQPKSSGAGGVLALAGIALLALKLIK